MALIDDLTEAQIDALLERFDETEPALQRRIALEFMLRQQAAEVRAKELEAEAARLRAENAKLTQCLEMHADEARRRMNQIEALRDDRERLRAEAERDALARLEAWRKIDHVCRWWMLSANGLKLTDRKNDLFAVDCPASLPGTPWAYVAGTNVKPATLAEVVHAALDEWAKTYEGGMAR